MADPFHAPGLSRIKRFGGKVERYWVASKAARAAGFLPRTVRVRDDADDAEAASLCRRMQLEAEVWLQDGPLRQEALGEGTIGWLCRQFETDRESPFRDKRDATQVFYRRHMKLVCDKAGGTFVSDVTGRDVRRWHREWKEERGDRTAYGCVQTLRRVVSYGVVDLSHDPCVRLTTILSEVAFSAPRRRERRASYANVVAFRKAAEEAEDPEPALALAVTLQFELGLRQKDVIGEWTLRLARGANRFRKSRSIDGWQWGLTWAQIDDVWVLVKPTSKFNGEESAEHDLKAHPELLALLEAIPRERRVGPVIIDHRTGLPFRADAFRRRFRIIARRSGWPDNVWNMDSRAGAVSEAFEAGADPADVMKTATHKQITTTMIYNRGALVQTNRVAAARQANRKKAG